jgi:hypothetical protein
MRLTLTVIRSPPNLHLLLKRRLAVTPKFCRFLDGGCFDPFEPETDSLNQNSSEFCSALYSIVALANLSNRLPADSSEMI